MINPLYSDGWPDLARIQAHFPLHGSGEIDHTTSSGEQFVFRFSRVGEVYWIAIISQPGYGNRASDLHSTHRLPLSGGGYRVCVTREPTDLPSAVNFALLWGECTSRYIHQGTRF